MRLLEKLACSTIGAVLLSGASVKSEALLELTDDLTLEGEGALYIHVKPEGFAPDEQPDTVAIDLYDDDNQQILTFRHSLDRNIEQVNEVWISKPGIFRLVRLRYGQRSWVRTKNSKLVLIRAGELSNLGSWSIKPLGDRSLQVAVNRTKTSYTFSKSNEQPFHAVIDGFSGKSQLVRKGHHLGQFNRAGPGGTYVASFSYYQNVDVGYKVQLRNKNDALKLVQQLDHGRKLFQTCYTQQVIGNPSGVIKFQFRTDPQARALTDVKVLKNNFRNLPLEGCIHNHLESMTYLSAAPNLGTITFNFKVRRKHL